MCNVILKDRKYSAELRDCMGWVSIRNCIQRGRLRRFEHLERIDNDSWAKKCKQIVVEGHGVSGRPQMTWVEVIHSDLRGDVRISAEGDTAQ